MLLKVNIKCCMVSKVLGLLKCRTEKPDSIITLCPQTDDDEIPEELLLGKHQLSELGNDSSKIKDMGIFNKVRVGT